MSFQSWQQLLISAQGAGGQLSDSSTPTSLLPGQAKVVLPANALAIGSVLRVTAAGQLSNVVTTPGTVTFDLKFGSIVVATTGAINMSGSAHTTLPVWWQYLLTCRAVGNGTSANFITVAKVVGLPFNKANAGTDPTTTFPAFLIPFSNAQIGNGFDSTVPNTIDLFGTFSVTTDPTNVTVHQFTVESLN